ncbi:MAG: hypothetical protein CL532_00820 [Aestuariivita sp.]|nr:hypothetical protein [Aestuariivita sp.]
MEQDTAEVESPQTTEETSIENVSTDDLRNALGITEQTTQEGVVPEPEGIAEEPQLETESQEPEVEGLESEEEKLAKRRIRPRNELDQQVIDLYRSEGFSGSFADASRVIYGQDAQPAQPQISTPQEQVEATPPDPVQGIDSQADNLRAEILELEGKVDTAAEDLETTEALKFQREIMRKELQLQNLTSRKEQIVSANEQQAYQTHRDKAMGSRDRVYEMYPALQDTESVVRKQFDDYVSNAQSDPDYAAVFDSPKWPELIASEFASRVAIPQEVPQQQVPQQQAPQMGTQAKVLTTGTTAQPVSAPATAAGLLQQVPNMSNDDIYKLLGAPGGAAPLM